MTTKTRHIDDLGRVVLPADVKEFGWTEKTPLDITVLDDGIVILRAHKPFCKLCGEADAELIPVERGAICKHCLQTALENNVRSDRPDETV